MTEIADIVRASAALAVFLLMALWEWAAPRREQTHPRRTRWPGNLALALLNVALARVLSPLTVVGVALVAASNGWGLMNRFAMPAALEAILAFVALDFVVYAQHVAFHRVGAIWRFHRVHHADLEFDVTTGLRFHPIEALISLVVKMTAVLALGAPALAVVAFEVALNATSMFNHGNVRLPRALDAALRTVLVTPDMHRIHHSSRADELNANFGFNLSWWDRLFRTYRAQPAAGHESMVIGLDQFRDDAELGLGHLLVQPWRAPSTPPRT